MINTERLILRRWRPEDKEPYVAMMADPEVGYWLGGFRAREVALADIELWDSAIARDGFGFFALERRTDGAFLGAAALLVLPADRLPGPSHELGWRLAREAWGFGYATEAARALLGLGFDRLNLSEILAFTAETNARSRSVMERIGMRRDESRDFDHSALAADHPLRRHVVYVASPR